MGTEDQGQGQETGTVQPDAQGQEQVQSAPEPQAQETGQGFLDPYLKDVPEEQRSVVQPILERYRQEQDANFNRRFEQIQEEARIPTMIHQALIQDPVTTLNWIADRMLEEQGVDVRQELLTRWGQSQQGQPEGQGQEQLQSSEQKALTAEEVERLLEEREQRRQQELQQQEFQKQQVAEQTKTINSWIDNAAKSFSLSLDDANGEDPLRAVIIMQANSLHEQGIARGQAAIEMAVEAIAKRFGSSSSSQGGTEQPRIADGGTPPPAKQIDVSDAKQRKARMEELFSSLQNS